MILTHHIIFTAYGFWLPNDPRGSWSEYIKAWELIRFGVPKQVNTPHSVAGRPHNHALRFSAKQALRYPPVHFNGVQARAIAHGFRSTIQRSGFTFHACAILPDHVHVVVARHRIHARQILNQMKGEASKALAEENIHPFQNAFLPGGDRHTPWAAKGWTVFLNTPEEVHAAIQYVNNNPLKENLPAQSWSFIQPYTF
ncbi:MAG TPA: transposase [Phycisphaerae bacterium]|nr:transposase [Phycisphaerae bacterium]